MPVLERMTGKLNRLGEDFAVGGSTYRGVFRVLDSGTMRTYLNDVEIMGITNPGLLLLTRPANNITTSDTITRDGRTYRVLRSIVHRLAGVAVVRVVVLG